uniref:Uncharacterized protein n=1 Tax=uncultured organism MedDCM-OCT-S08-C256 TaxID=743636 RepID=D6PKS1_9ZZZZ|nr:hypothetical protein [uncultured organism MedDCM-OCT-S08-C256]
MVSIHHFFIVTRFDNRSCYWTPIASSADKFASVEGELFALPATNSNNKTSSVTSVTSTFTGVFTPVAIIKQN